MNRFHLGKTLFIRRSSDLTAVEVTAWNQLIDFNLDLRRAFLSSHYVAAVAQSGRDVFVLVGYESGMPVFFLPLQRQPGWLGKLGLFEPVGGSMTDYFGLIALDDIEIDMPTLLSETNGLINSVFFTHLDETQKVYGLQIDEYRTGLCTWLGNVPENYWSNLQKIDKKLVYDTERRERKLVSEYGPLTFEWKTKFPIEDLGWLISSKKMQYSRTGKMLAPLFDEKNTALLDILLNAHEPQCSGILSILRVEDHIIAAHFGLQCRNVLHVWFPVYNVKFASYSPGRVLFKYMFIEGAKQGVEIFDRGEGDNQAKRDFANLEHRFGRGLWYANHLRGRLAYFAQRLAWKFG